MQAPNMDTETCPCRVCRSDVAYVYPFCESPLIIMTTMEIADLYPENESELQRQEDTKAMNSNF